MDIVELLKSKSTLKIEALLSLEHSVLDKSFTEELVVEEVLSSELVASILEVCNTKNPNNQH